MLKIQVSEREWSDMKIEITRLRAIEDAARDYIGLEGDKREQAQTLRAALKAKP